MRFKSKNGLKEGIKSFSLAEMKERSEDDFNSIERIELIMPISENLIVPNRGVTIVDMPGIEDAICFKKMISYIESNRYKILPMFVVDLTQGTLNLVQYKLMKRIFRNMKNFSIPFVMTKFGNFVNDAQAKLMNDGHDPDDIELLI